MARYLNNEQRTILVKILAFLGLVRWYNLLLVGLAQYLAALFLLNPNQAKMETVSDPNLHLLIFASSLVIAGGYLINAFYDLEKDLANQPDKLIIGRIISKSFALNTYLLFNLCGTLLGLLIHWRVSVFLAVFTFLLWLYSHKLRKKAFIGALSATFLSVCSFFVVCVYYWQLNWAIVLYVGFIILAELIRELVKEMESIKGDVLFGNLSVPILFGIPRTKQLVYLLMILGLAPSLALYLVRGWTPLMSFLLFAYFLWMIAAVMLHHARVKKDFRAVNNLLKVVIVLGVFSIVLLGE